jgi:ectoine hydroxylase-related dioxygenase (phytanoyl-CoA dioxygenase family)
MFRYDEVSADDVLGALGTDGFAIVTDVLPPAELAAVQAEFHRLLENTPLGTSSFVGYRTKRIFALLAKTRAADPLAINPLVLEVLDGILGHYQLSAPVVIEIQPDEKAQTLHRDETSYPIRHHDGGELVANVMWALDDFTVENGATRIIPGSQHWPDDTATSEDQTVPAVMPAGSICIFLGSVIHGGGANRTDRPRLGLVMEYAASWLRSQENLCLAVDRATVRTLPTRLAELIGYDMYPPFMGYVDGRHPNALLEIGPTGE